MGLGMDWIDYRLLEIFHDLLPYLHRFGVDKLFRMLSNLLNKNQEKLVEYNIKDCKLAYDILEKTKIIELFQSLCDCTFWYISQIFNLDYVPVQTVRFETDFIKAWKTDTYMPIDIIDKVKNYLQNKRD